MRTTLFTALLLLFLAPLTMAQQAVKPDLVIETEFGNITLVLYKDTPVHRKNFLKLARKHFFDGTVFHRVINGFMIQGGDPWSTDTTRRAEWGNGGPGYDLKAEIMPNHFHRRGVLAAAREGDDINPERKSSGSQFYIVVGKTFTDEILDKVQERVRSSGNTNFTFTAEQREAYKTRGGAPWLDTQYTVFGEVVEGMDVVDKIAALQAGTSDKPSREIKMKVRKF